MRLWLDDLRPAPDGWVHVLTVDAARAELGAGHVVEASLDHDLGPDTPEAYALVLWMAEHGIWPSDACAIHSANPVGVANMSAVISRYGPYTRRSPDGRRFRR